MNILLYNNMTCFRVFSEKIKYRLRKIPKISTKTNLKLLLAFLRNHGIQIVMHVSVDAKMLKMCCHLLIIFRNITSKHLEACEYS